MTMMPPRLPTWLLKRCLSSDVSDVIAGDLFEQYQGGRSAAWYWRQVAGSIAATTWQDLRSHKLLAFRAVVMGWMSAYITSLVAVRVLFGGSVRLAQLQWGQYSLATSLIFMAFCVSAAVSGWVVARLHSGHRGPLVFGYVAMSLLLVVVALPWNSQFVTRDVFLSLLPFHVAYGLFGFPISVAFGVVLSAGRMPAVVP